jgi:hypothetical protein
VTGRLLIQRSPTKCVYVYIVEVKKVKFVLEQAMKAQNETRDVAELFL